MTNQWKAAEYDAKHAFVYGKVKGLVELLAPKAGERILDLDCGTGRADGGNCRARRWASWLFSGGRGAWRRGAGRWRGFGSPCPACGARR